MRHRRAGAGAWRGSAGLRFPKRRITSLERDNLRERVFFGEDDHTLYRDLLREACRRDGVGVWFI